MTHLRRRKQRVVVAEEKVVTQVADPDLEVRAADAVDRNKERRESLRRLGPDLARVLEDRAFYQVHVLELERCERAVPRPVIIRQAKSARFRRSISVPSGMVSNAARHCASVG